MKKLLTTAAGAPVVDNQNIQERHIANCSKAEPMYGAGVAKALSLLR